MAVTKDAERARCGARTRGVRLLGGAVAVWAVLGGGALAETPLERDDAPTPQLAETDGKIDENAREYLDDEAFRRAFEGRTVHVHDNGVHYGSEYYLPGDRTVWVPDNGPCMPGRWVYEQPRICFYYQDGVPHCWTVFRQGEDIFVQSAESGLLLEVYAVEEIPLSCDPELFS